MEGFIWAVLLFGLFSSLGFMLSGERSKLAPLITGSVGAFFVWTATIQTKLTYVFLVPAQKVIEGGIISQFEWSAFFILITLIWVVIVAVVNGLISYDKDERIILWQK